MTKEINIVRTVISDNGYVSLINGTIFEQKQGFVDFEVFRKQSAMYLSLRIYNKYLSTIVYEFENKFISSDYENRRMIKWLGDNTNIMFDKFYKGLDYTDNVR